MTDAERDIVPGVGTIAAVLVVLLLLTTATVGIATLDLSAELHVTAAMLIAALKAILVALFFMHLLHEGRPIRVMALAAILLFATLLALVLVDLLNRGGG